MIGPLLAAALSISAAPAGPKAVPPGGISVSRLERIDTVIEESIAAHEMPGAVVLVGHRGRTVYRRDAPCSRGRSR